jgi:2',3'-cyclic-nucleotide 2'-phosphodiesterase/3'-nucleotidase
VRPGQTFLLATNSYRAAGCGGYLAARPERMVPERLVDVGHAMIRDILLRHFASPPATASQTTSFSFLPLPGTSVTFDTAPEATRHLAEVAHLHPEPLGTTPEGFARFRLHL